MLNATRCYERGKYMKSMWLMLCQVYGKYVMMYDVCIWYMRLKQTMMWFTVHVLATGIWNESGALLEEPVALVGATEMKVELGALLEEPVALVGATSSIHIIVHVIWKGRWN